MEEFSITLQFSQSLNSVHSSWWCMNIYRYAVQCKGMMLKGCSSLQPAACVMREFILSCYLLLISQATRIRFSLYYRTQQKALKLYLLIFCRVWRFELSWLTLQYPQCHKIHEPIHHFFKNIVSDTEIYLFCMAIEKPRGVFECSVQRHL